MLTKQQEQQLINLIPEGTNGEDRRVAYSVITGIREDKTPSQIAGYYTADQDLVNKWYDFFGFSKPNSPQKAGRGRKSKDLAGFIKSNTGRVVTPKIVSDELGISLPTFYNYYNANRHLFKKVRRGEFEIINPEKERNSSK
jgi:hypothetical protein